MTPTPKEKAEDLLYQMRYDHMDRTLTKKHAKRCAKIAVVEIMAFVDQQMQGWCDSDWIQYWQEVEQEIGKL